MPNWNGLADAIEYIESLERVTYPNFEVIVIDNASKGDDVRVLGEKFGDYTTFIENDKNYSCGEGYNSGIRFVLKNSGSKYIMTMNNDVVLDPALRMSLARWLKAMKS
ncbi:glycosyltransferase [Chloroflexota bacterium]